MTISHEFRTPLITSLMLLENIIVMPNLLKSTKDQLWLVISSINMLLCLVNDLLDMQMIEHDKFAVKIEAFQPMKTFNLILDMFAPQARLMSSIIRFESLKSLSNPRRSDPSLPVFNRNLE